MSNILSGLNEEQKKAVTTVHGPVLVLAGPGSGKTRVLTRRIAYMIDEVGIAPWHILAVTFTNKAAGEMRARVEKIFEEKFGPPPPGQPPRLGGLTIGTFHSICARILRVETAAIGFEPNWVIYDTDDQVSLIRAIMRDMNLDEKRYAPRAVQAHISKSKNDMVTPDTFHAATYFEEIAGRVYRNYQLALQSNNAMDFDDLLLRTVLLLRESIDVRTKYQKKWQYLLIDEFQDTNAPQYELVHLLSGAPEENHNLFVVGDEDQSIYRFRGADYRNVQLFRRDYPSNTLVLLEHNYRSTQSILDVANAVISNNRNRTPKHLRTDNGGGVPATIYAAYNEIDEAEWVAKEIKKLVSRREYTLGDFAVAYRTNAQSRVLEEMFVSLGLKHRLIGATRFYDRKEVKDALAYLRLIHNPADSVALERIINVPPRGIGQKTHEALRNWAQEIGESESVALMILHHGLNRASTLLGRTLPAGAAQPPIAGRQLKALADFSALLENWVEQEKAGRYPGVADLLDAVLTQSDYIHTLRDGTEEGEDRFENLQQLRVVATLYVQGMPNIDEGGTPLSQFLQETALVSDADALDDSGGAITLLTLHTAKGLEYPVVFIVGLEEGILPHSRSIESDNNNPRGEDMAEERRLFYVGITRAKRRLYLLHALRRSLWGGSELQTPSRFLDEIPEELLSGMVDKRGRQESSARRMTNWDETDDSARLPRSQTGGQWSGRSKSTPWPSSSQPAKKPISSDQESGKSAGQPKQAYWSPSSGQQPIDRKSTAKKPAAPAPTKFNRRDSVQHPTFGVGTVIESVTSRDGEEVTVAFPGVGIKKLMAEYLKKL